MKNFDISSKAKGLIFDLDGTLLNTMPFHFQAWQQTAIDHGMIMTKEFLESMMGGSVFDISAALLRNHGIDNIDPVSLIDEKSKYYNELVKQVTPIDEVMQVVLKYHGKLPMAIGTGGTMKTISLSLEQTDIRKYFDYMVTAEDVKNHKPAPDTFLKCAELIGVAPEFCEVFEDGEPGLLAAKNAGMIATDVRKWFDPKW